MFRRVPYCHLLSSTEVMQEKMVVTPDSPSRVVYEHVPIKEFSKKQLHPDDNNMSSVVKTGVVIEPGNTSSLFNPKDPADFDAQAEQIYMEELNNRKSDNNE